MAQNLSLLSMQRFDHCWRLNRGRQTAKPIQNGQQLGAEKIQFAPELMQRVIFRIDSQLQLRALPLAADGVELNNAGITRDGLLMRMKDEDWDDVLEVNMTASMILCRAAMRGCYQSLLLS